MSIQDMKNPMGRLRRTAVDAANASEMFGKMLTRAQAQAGMEGAPVKNLCSECREFFSYMIVPGGVAAHVCPECCAHGHECAMPGCQSKAKVGKRYCSRKCGVKHDLADRARRGFGPRRVRKGKPARRKAARILRDFMKKGRD